MLHYRHVVYAVCRVTYDGAFGFFIRFMISQEVQDFLLAGRGVDGIPSYNPDDCLFWHNVSQSLDSLVDCCA
jgi:hypothetical protein